MKTVFFDFETTGLDAKTDRIVQIGLKVGDKEKCILLNPEMPILPTATEVHGICDGDVKDAKTFKMIAPKLHRIFTDAILIGFGIKRFDIPLLVSEFARCGIDWDPSDQPIIDALEIFHQHNPRDLTAAVERYCGEDHEDAHDALADVLATEKVFTMQCLEHYKVEGTNHTLGFSVIAEQLNPGGLGWDGKLKLQNDKVVLTFGKHRGKTLDEVARQDRGWLEWALDNKVFCKANARKVLEVL